MTIPIIYKKRYSFIKLILISILVALILITAIILSPQLLYIIDYNLLVVIIISVILSHFIIIFLFVFQKKYKIIGSINFNNDILSIIYEKNEYLYNYNEIIYLNIFILSQDQISNKNVFNYNDVTGNFISIQLSECTLVYEIILKENEYVKKLELLLKENSIVYCIDNTI